MKDNIEFINNVLRKYLVSKEYKQYAALIEAVIKDDANTSAKYNLWTLIMNHGTEKLSMENMSTRLANLYCADKNINEYLDSIIFFNPKLNYVEISGKSGKDSKDEYSLYLTFPVQYDSDVKKHFENADKVINRIKEIMQMILLESRTISAE